jgi:transcription initiation factor TFIIB
LNPSSEKLLSKFAFTCKLQRYSEEINLQRISEISGMAEGTIRTSYEDMYPYAGRLLPAAYQDKIHMLTAPSLDKEEKAALAAGLESDEMALLLPPI